MPVAAAFSISGRSTISNEAIFIAGTPSTASSSTASWSKTLEKKWMPRWRAWAASSDCHSRGSEISSSSSAGALSLIAFKYSNFGVLVE